MSSENNCDDFSKFIYYRLRNKLLKLREDKDLKNPIPFVSVFFIYSNCHRQLLSGELCGVSPRIVEISKNLYIDKSMHRTQLTFKLFLHLVIGKGIC